MQPIKFEDYRDRILSSLNTRPAQCHACNHPSMALVDGFINLPLQKDFSASIIIGGQSLPLIAVVCPNCGTIQLFALKALIPDIGL